MHQSGLFESALCNVYVLVVMHLVAVCSSLCLFRLRQKHLRHCQWSLVASSCPVITLKSMHTEMVQEWSVFCQVYCNSWT